MKAKDIERANTLNKAKRDLRDLREEAATIRTPTGGFEHIGVAINVESYSDDGASIHAYIVLDIATGRKLLDTLPGLINSELAALGVKR